MNVETYEVNEVASDGSTDALDAEAVALIERLGLKGQQTLVSGAGGEKPAVLPYQAMTAEEVGVYEILFPVKTALDAYAEGPIPMRVLQVAALALERSWFSRLEVWHKRSGSAKEDPLLVGIVGGTNSWEVRQRFLLARWGDALAPYAQQLAQAAATARDRLRAAATRSLAEIQTAIRSIEGIGDRDAVRWLTRGAPMAGHTDLPEER